MSRQYVTTAIDFPNAAPHMGHVLEKILADVIVRWFRLRGDEVRFHLGNDENGIKIQNTAKAMNITPRELVDMNAPVFEDMFRKMNISFDYFIRTADPVSHWPTVTALWNRLKDAGMLEKRSYTGLYCTGCERFVTEKDLIDGKCPDHGIAPEQVTEENWFFLMSKKEKDVRAALESKRYEIVPSWRGNEVAAFLDQGLEDISFSRSKKTLSWGVPVPGDEDQVMYVWCDNLTSYISSLGLLTDHEEREWWDDATVTHVIGKDIARFHAINWPAMLDSVDVKIPDRLLIHGFLTSDGQKMSKTLGNVVKPEEVLEHFKGNPDPLRFYLSHEIPVGNDGDFSWKRIDETYDAFLRNQLGNLLNRVLVMLQKEGGQLDLRTEPPFVEPNHAVESENAKKHWEEYEKAMNALETSEAIKLVTKSIGSMNVWITHKKPWELEKEKKIAELSSFAEHLRHVALMLLPFVPDTAYRISKQLGVPYAEQMKEKSFILTDELKAWGGAKEWTTAGQPEILFAPLDQ